MSTILLDVRNLKKYFPIKKGVFQRTVGWIRAVDDVSFFIRKGETLGLVGESGCGKTTTGKAIIGLNKATGGQVLYNVSANGHSDFKDVLHLRRTEMNSMRRKMQIIFQDPYGSLNPRMTVFNMLGEIINYYRLEPTRQAKQEKIRFLLNTVGLHSEDMNKYPHEFSGGQRQRIGIARALIMDPELIICDEPVSALDVSIQAQIINLLVRLRSEFGLTYIFIAHDLGVVKHISDRVAVMYLGKIVEVAPKKVLFQNPLHPYTEALLSAVPVPDPEHKKSRILLKGDVPSQLTIPKGCSFHTRCIYAQDICSHEQPLLLDKGSEHYCSCHFR
jgi:oligopeptide/dipeptide ABC transporter ATP-binding protein